MVRLIAIAGAVLIFAIVFFIADFITMRLVDGLPTSIVVAATVFCALVALVPALRSYHSTLFHQKIRKK